MRSAQMPFPGGRQIVLPRLEGVLLQLKNALGAEILRVLDPLEDAPANSYHLLFAHHLAAGGAHITVNLDSCLERAQRQVGRAGNGASVLYVHGRYSRRGPEQAVASLEQVNKGLAERVMSGIETRVRGKQWLVFVGYGGGDYFDVDPFFAGLDETERLTDWPDQVIWIDHRADCAWEDKDWRTAAKVDGKRILCLLAKASSVHYLVGDARVYLDACAERWGISDLEPQDSGGEATRTPFASADVWKDPARATASAHVLASLGAAGELRRLEPAIRSAERARPEGDSGRIAMVEKRWMGRMHGGQFRTAVRVAREIRATGADRGYSFALVGAARVRWHVLSALFPYVRALREYGRAAQLHAEEKDRRTSALVHFLDWHRRAERRGMTRVIRRGLVRVASVGGRWNPIPGLYCPQAAYEEVVDDEEFLARHPQTVRQLTGSCRGIPELPYHPRLSPQQRLRDVTLGDALIQDNSIHEFLTAVDLGKMSTPELAKGEEVCERLGDWDGAISHRLERISRLGGPRVLGPATARVELGLAGRLEMHWDYFAALVVRARAG